MKHFINFALFGVLLMVETATAAAIAPTCMKLGDHTAVTVLLVDRTDLMKDKSRFAQMISSLKESLKPGERLVATSITGRANSAKLLIDVVRPTPSAWISKLKSRKEEKDFAACLTSLEAVMSEALEKHPSSSILETLAFVSQVLETDSVSHKRVIIYSDMIQNSDEVSFYKKSSINTKLMLAQAKKAGLIKSFSGVRFYYVTNSGSLGERKDREIEAFWKEYTAQCKGTFRLYGPALVGE